MWLSILRFIPAILSGIGLSSLLGLGGQEVVEVPEQDNSISKILPLVIIAGLVFYLIKGKK